MSVNAGLQWKSRTLSCLESFIAFECDLGVRLAGSLILFLLLKDKTVDPLTRNFTANQGDCELVHIKATLMGGCHFNQRLLFQVETMIVTIIGFAFGLPI